jgi:hypothetical protein
MARFPLLRHLLRRLQVQLLERPSLALVLAAIVALSLASAERTFRGMQNFTHVTVLSALITFGVQILMLVLAWRIGDVWATDREVGASILTRSQGAKSISLFARLWRLIAHNFFARNFLLFASFAICALICVFFSFDAFYRAISTQTQRDLAAKDQALKLWRELDADLSGRLAAQQDAVAAQLASGPAWKEYADRINAVITAATGKTFLEAEAAQAETVKARWETEQKQRNAVAANRDQLEDENKDLTRQLGDLNKDRDKLDASLKQQSKAIADKQDEADRTRILRDNEATDGNQRLNDKNKLDVGRGPRYRRYDAILTSLLHELEDLRAQQARLKTELDANTNSRNELQHKLDDNNQKLKNDQTQLNGSRGDVAGPAAGAQKAEDEARKLSPVLATFTNKRTPDSWSAIEQQCDRVVELIREVPGYADNANKLDCSPSQPTRATAESLLSLEKRREDFRTNCSNAAPQDLAFIQVVDGARRCLQIAQMPKESAQYADKLNALREEQDPNAHTFNKTIAGFKYGDNMAYLAVVIAAGLDGLIFIAGMWGARASASQLTRTGAATASEIDDHAEMMMAVEIRPESERPPEGWPEPPGVYKARIFTRHLEPYAASDSPDLTCRISYRGLTESEREAVSSVLKIGPFAVPVRGTGDQTWAVTDRLVRYVTRIAASYDRLQHLYAMSPQRKTFYRPPDVASQTQSQASTAHIWDGAANGEAVLGASEDEIMGRGFDDFAAGPTRSMPGRTAASQDGHDGSGQVEQRGQVAPATSALN